MAPHQDPLQDWSTYLSSCWECWWLMASASWSLWDLASAAESCLAQDLSKILPSFQAQTSFSGWSVPGSNWGSVLALIQHSSEGPSQLCFSLLDWLRPVLQLQCSSASRPAPLCSRQALEGCWPWEYSPINLLWIATRSLRPEPTSVLIFRKTEPFIIQLGYSYQNDSFFSILSLPECSFIEIDRRQTRIAFGRVTSRSTKRAERGGGKAQVVEEWDSAGVLRTNAWELIW